MKDSYEVCQWTHFGRGSGARSVGEHSAILTLPVTAANAA